MADDTYPDELYIHEIDIYDYSDEIWNELNEIIDFENNQTDHDAWFWEGDQEAPDDDHDAWFWGDDDRE